ncbi:hypothetical protein DFJ73DRAFT_831409 [Zopfochytrium polystomum]|nr:hypothetical protein DFJ73DRAFT_831409 [Zopfochytrium polystomum]
MPSSSSGALFSVLDDAVFAQPPETMIPAVHHSPPLARPDVRTEGSHSFGATPPVTPAVDFETLLTQALVVHATSPNPNPNPAMFAPLLDLDQSLPAALATLAAIAAPESPLLFAPTFADAGAKVSSFPSPSQSSTCSKRPRCSAAERSDSSAPAKRRKTRATPIVVVDGSPAATTLSPDDIHCVVEPTGQRVFLCPHPGCSLKAKRRFNVETHLKTHDANRTKNFQCRTCGCLFFRPYELVRHVERKGH